MNKPTLSDLSPKARSLLEQALHGENDATKARVLQLVLETGINPEEEFFLISLGLSHLKVLLYDAPKQFQAWSIDLQQNLDAWGGKYAQLLQIIANKAEATDALTETAGQLAGMLTAHTQTCNALIRQLQVSHKTWGDSWEQQTAVNAEIQQGLRTVAETLAQQSKLINTQLKQLAAEVQASNRPNPLSAIGLSPDQGWKRAVFYATAFFLSIGAMSTSMLALVYLRDRPLQRATAGKVEYLLQKQNRQDCLEGIKPPDSPECKTLQ